ncbi:phosphatase PAP2 family protein [Arenibacter palladensis]|uniref:phosphatase PAP2 family protein n=1 Tax=Arenibacter palladensis TaxID=237373 RepID=UPI0026E25E73|nr:phosphatase PAP2 family protein [Arenibacter palladensis]MDO6603819.1 phosphatase PAP2 family protein [Arenibacter palladensis]
MAVKVKVIGFCLVLFLCIPKLEGQSHVKDTLTTWQTLAYDGASAFGGLKYAYSRPFHWGKKDFLTAGGIVLGTAALFTFDEESSNWFQGQEEDVPGVLKETGYYLGKPLYNYSINGGIYLIGLFTKNEDWRKTGVLLISSATTVGLIQTVSKTLVGRARPIANVGKASFEPFSKEAAYHSFPSGHTILAFTTFYAIGKQFENPWAKGGFYTLGLLSPVSRLWSGAHWLTDVALSIAVSVVVVDSIDRYLEKERYPKEFSKDRISWKLQVGPGTIGLRGTF